MNQRLLSEKQAPTLNRGSSAGQRGCLLESSRFPRLRTRPCRVVEAANLISSVFHCLGDLLFLLLRNGTVRCLSTPDLTLVALLDVLLLLPGFEGSLAANILSGLDKSRRRSRMRCVIGNSREI